jgi:phytanoyl-CoA hydroxylase
MSRVGWVRRIPGRLGRRARGVFRRAEWVRPPDSDEALRQEYLRNGFVAGGPLVDEAELSSLRAELERVVGLEPKVVVKDGAGGEIHKLYNLHSKSEAFAAILRKPRLTSLLGLLTGGTKFRVLMDQIQDKPPRTGGWNGWHVDLPTFPLIPPYTAITAWIALDDIDLENGCLRMVPGSQAFDASDLTGEDWGIPELPDLYCGHSIRVAIRPLRAGHVHFHHARTWHASSPNPSSKRRRALSIHFASASDRYRAGGLTSYPGLSTGDSLDSVAPLVLSAESP